MDKAEARSELAEALVPYERQSYAEIARRVGSPPDFFERRGASGALYQIEVECIWDAAPAGAIRVIGGIDDGGWSAFMPLMDGFLVQPESPSQSSARETTVER